MNQNQNQLTCKVVVIGESGKIKYTIIFRR